MTRSPTAVAEVRSKSASRLDFETADRWASRSIACYRLAKEARDVDEKAEYLARATDYRHEALEHAALVGDRGKTVRVVQDRIDKRAKALGFKIEKRSTK